MFPNKERGFFLPQPQYITRLWGIVGGATVHFVEAVETDAVALTDEIHALTRADNVGFVRFVCTPVFLLQIDDVTLTKGVSFIQVVILTQFAGRDAELVRKAFKGVA